MKGYPHPRSIAKYSVGMAASKRGVFIPHYPQSSLSFSGELIIKSNQGIHGSYDQVTSHHSDTSGV